MALPCSRGIGEPSLCAFTLRVSRCNHTARRYLSLSLSHTPTHPSFLHKELHIFLPKISLKTHFFPHIYIYIIFFVCLCVYIRRTSPFCVDLFFGEPSHSHPSFLCCRCCCLTGRLLGGSPIRPGNYLGGLAVLLSAGGMHPLCNE